jgi:DNA-binding LacI/PurR family transcriptional regulator
MREMGRTACSKLFQNLDTFEKTEIIEYPTELIVRESTGPAAPG